MRKQMFKLAGVKNEKEFYKKFPSEKSFMSKHGEAFKAKFGGNFMGGDTGNIMEGIGGMSGMAGTAGQAAGGALGAMGGYAGMINTVGDIGKGLKAIKAGKEARIGAEQMAGVSAISRNAAMTPDVDSIRQQSEIMSGRYNAQMRPVNGEELFPINGVGTNVLAKKGAMIPKAELGNQFAQNMQGIIDQYNPNMITAASQNLATPPAIKPLSGGAELATSANIKPIAVPAQPSGKTTGGFKDFAGGYGGAAIGRGASNLMGNDGGSQLGGTLGKTAGTIIGGPIGGAIGNVVGKVAGGLIDTNDNKQHKAEDRMAADTMEMTNMDFGKAMRSNLRGYAQDGGEFPGGEQDIQPLWGGGVVPISENPYTDGGETLKFYGDSHKKGGIGINYAGNKIEAEGGEPAIKLKEGNEDEKESLVIYGDLHINKETAQMIGDEKAKGKKFKNYVGDISKNENKVNKKREAAGLRAADLSENYKFGRLGIETQAIITKGADIKLKGFAEKKENAAYAQNALNDTAEELGIDPTVLAKGGNRMEKWFKKHMDKSGALTNIPTKGQERYAEYGGEFEKAQLGLTGQGEINEDAYQRPAWTTTGRTGNGIEDGAARGSFRRQGQDPQTGLYGGHTLQELDKYQTQHNWYDWSNFNPKDTESVIRFQKAWNAHTTGNQMTVDGKMGDQTFSAVNTAPVNAGMKSIEYANKPFVNLKPMNVPGQKFKVADEEKGRGWNFDPAALANIFGRGSDAEELDGNQLLGEMYGLSHNQVEPVYAQGYQPELDVPYDISLQDQLNRNTSTFRGAQKLSNGNPAALSMMAAQQYGADQPVLASQFRANQGKKDQVYSGNRATLNDAKIRNLGIYDQQFVRQSQAKSNTKEATQLALNSISDKYAKNKLEQRTLKTYENMYNYRFGKDYVAQNVNDAANLEAMEQGAVNINDPVWKQYNPGFNKDADKKKSSDASARYGTLAKSFKKF